MKTLRLFGNKPVGTAIIISSLWMGSACVSFGSITISQVGNLDCSGSVTVRGDVTCNPCDGSPPTVTITNSTSPGNVAGTVVANPGCTNGTWIGVYTNKITLKKGVNVITAKDSCKGSASLTVNSSGNGGAGTYMWTYKKLNRVTSPGCGFKMQITISCLTPNTTDTYADYETHKYNSGEACDAGRGFTEFPGNNKTTDANGTMTIIDTLTDTCPPFTNRCYADIAKVWHIYDRASGKDVTSNPDTVIFDEETKKPGLTVSDSQCGPAEKFD